MLFHFIPKLSYGKKTTCPLINKKHYSVYKIEFYSPGEKYPNIMTIYMNIDDTGKLDKAGIKGNLLHDFIYR